MKLTAKQRAKIYREAAMLLERKDLIGFTNLFRGRDDENLFTETLLFFEEHRKWANKHRWKDWFDKENDSLRSLIFYLCEQIALNP